MIIVCRKRNKYKKHSLQTVLKENKLELSTARIDTDVFVQVSIATDNKELNHKC